MTYEEASKETERLREAYDRSYTDGEKRRIALLYREVTGKDFQHRLVSVTQTLPFNMEL